MCIFEGLRSTKAKPSGYFMLSAIFQETDEIVSDFLACLLKTLIKYTSPDPESIEGQISLKDVFITHQPQTLGKVTEISLDISVKIAFLVFCNWDCEKARERKPRDQIVAA